MRIVLVGAPNSGKSRLASVLTQKNQSMKRSAPPQDLDKIMGKELAYGMFTDYRVELKLAVDRALEMERLDHAVYTHSLIDSLAYTARRLNRIANHGGISEDLAVSWVNVLELVSSLAIDSFRSDFIFFVQGGNVEQYEALREVLDAFQLSYIEVDQVTAENVLNVAEDCAKMVHGQGVGLR
jgi:hypothetical protein